MRSAWLYQYERKNNSLSQWHLKNFINPPLSLMRLNQLECSYNNSCKHYLQHAQETGEGYNIRFFEVHPELREDFVEATDCENDMVYKVTHLTYNSLNYRAGLCLLVSWEENWPCFSKINDILIQEDKRLLVCSKLITVQYNWRVNAYQVEDADVENVLILDDMKNRWPVPEYTIGKERYIVNRHAHFGGGFF